jgi:hypothetical protein
MDARAVDMAHFQGRMREARREIACARLIEFAAQAEQIAAELPAPWHREAMTALRDIALAGGLTRIHGAQLIEAILDSAFDRQNQEGGNDGHPLTR